MTAREHKAVYESAGEKKRVAASLEGDRLQVTVGESAPASYSARLAGANEVVLRDAQGRILRAFVAPGAQGEMLVSIGGLVRRVTPLDERAARARAGHAHDAALEAPMPGTCRDVFVKPGDKVEKGQTLVLIEAMKMEHELRAPRAGTVKTVSAKRGEPVMPGSPLIELE